MTRTVHTGETRSYFPGINQVTYEGPDSDNPLAFKAYDPARVDPGQDDGGASALRHLLLAHVLRRGCRSFWPWHPRIRLGE